MGWGLLVGSRLGSWHNTGQNLLLLRKIPKLRTATVGYGCLPLIWPGLWLTSALSQLQQLLIIFVLPLSSTRLSVKERERNCLFTSAREHGRCGVLSPGRDRLLQWLCVTWAPCMERSSRDLAEAQPDSSPEQARRWCFVLLSGAPASAKPSCSLWDNQVLGMATYTTEKLLVACKWR